ncbi:N-acetylmuramoyl-L-alanine amidase [Nocardioides dongkuii]|uniref:N-acetylmuramoyl-L-alanine amidase n=1 Tax=Nocardioides dongkuii TaxID=2760089 RepID=UPI0018782AD1|nr:N-acetylmuramoyl-L-alanine amidase [Nocardioides dongkuii]
MPASKSRFVTACQQLLALGVVLAVLTPAASIVTLDVVHEAPLGGAVPAAPTSGMAAYSHVSAQASLVPAAPVEATVEEVPLTAPATTVAGRVKAPTLEASRTTAADGAAALTSTPQPVTGYGAVGVTWQHGLAVDDESIEFGVRTLDDGVWSDWAPMEYHDEHGPDPDSPEGQQARPGTTELLVGEVDQVQVQVTAQDALPADMKLAVIDPGQSEAEELEKAEIDTGLLDGEQPAPAPATPAAPEAAEDEAMELSAAIYTPKPTIYSRAQWGADERLRDKGSLHYYEVHAGFVHHTVNANEYSRAEVPGILRSIYAYHTRSRGWSDVGYNYLVDRFGRIWEGRAGGVDRPVVGAHTQGYNDYSFAMSAIGNFELKKPGRAMVQAYGALFAWKLSLHGVAASSTNQVVGPRTFPGINGHRDAGSTACPGKYLYAKIPKIRKLAAGAQQGWSGRELESNIAGSPHPDLVVRRASDARLMVWPTTVSATGVAGMGRPIDTGRTIKRVDRLMNAGDWDRDGFGDVVMRKRNGNLLVRPGNGAGQFGKATRIGTGFGGVKLLAAVGDMTGDGWPDLMGQVGGVMRIYPGRGAQALGSSYVAHAKIKGARLSGIGRWDTDGAPDSLVRSGRSLVLYPGNGPGGLTGARTLSGNVSAYDWVIGIRDIGLVGRPDVVVREKASGRLLLLPGTANGVGAPVHLDTGAEGFDLAG